MKTVLYLTMMAFLAGCSSLSSDERKELSLLKCEKVIDQLAELRNLSSAGTMFSLGSALIENGIEEDLVYGIIKASKSEEAITAYNENYKEKIELLMFKILKSSGCLKDLDLNSERTPVRQDYPSLPL